MRTWPALVLTFPQPGTPPPDGEPDPRDLASAELDGLDIAAIVEPSDSAWQVCFQDDGARQSAVDRFSRAPWAAAIHITSQDLPDEDWARRSQASLGAVTVGAIVVTPPWDAAATAPAADCITLTIEPAMGFGSGHHATTRLCLAALQRLDLRGGDVLDIGTGSGVLALAAARLGATRVIGVDVDPDALENARLNATLNGSPPAVAFVAADFRQGGLDPASVVVANLTGGMLAASVPELLQACRPGGWLILSGITAEEAEAVTAAFRPHVAEEWRGTEDAWCAFLYTVTATTSASPARLS
ncbi:MAG: 50S ribosomal protein L11 methyltransferase [Acidobacteria bacterium]|nr:50S ribosomal protein L11 methyltransferase [Acidobacteriota bacterium]